MGIDYLSCDHCGDGFPDCVDYVYCSCDKHWCSYDCALEDGFEELDEDEYPELDEDERKSCKYCREEDFDDSVLLNFLMDKFGWNRETVIDMYKLGIISKLFDQK